MIEIRVHLIATNGFPSHNFNSQAFLGNGQSRDHTSTWKRVIEKSFRHIRGKFLVLRQSEGGPIVAGLPLYDVTSWLTGSRLVSVPYGTLCDPLVGCCDELASLLSYPIRLNEDPGYGKFRMGGILQADKMFFDERFLLTNTHKHHYLSLESEFREIVKTFKRTVRQSKNIGDRAGLEVVVGEDEAGLKAFHELYSETRKRNHVPTQPYHYFFNLVTELNRVNAISLLLVRLGENMVGSGIVIKFNGRATLEFLASSSKALALRPNHALVWAAIEMAHREGLKIFDFGRTNPEDQGLMRFKRSWGTMEADLAVATLGNNCKSSIYNRNSSVWKISEFMSEELPAPLYATFSKFVYRHTG